MPPRAVDVLDTSAIKVNVSPDTTVDATSDSTDVEEPQISSVDALDAGHGWNVTLVCWVLHIIYLGTQYSFGVFYPFLLDEFNESRGYTAMIFGVQVGFVTSFGLFSGPLVRRFGHRPVALFGNVLQSICIAIAAISTSVTMLIFFFGAGVGISFSLSYLATMATINTWFDKQRGFAVGLASSGAGIGQAAINPLVYWLCETYSWRWAMGVLSILTAVIMTPMLLMLRLPQTANSTGEGQCESRADDHKDSSQQSANESENRTDSSPAEATELDETSKPSTASNSASSRTCSFVCSAGRGSEAHTGGDSSSTELSNVCEDDTKDHITDDTNQESGGPKTNQVSANAGKGNLCTQTLSCTGIIDLSFFRDPVFATWFFGLIVASFGYFSPFTHLVKYANDVGVDDSLAPMLMSIIGVSNILGRILTGRVADYLGRLPTFAVSMCLAGTFTALLPVFTTFEAMCLYAVVFGYFGGAFVGLYSVITADYFGVANLPSAIGVVMCSWTLGAFMGAPISGWLYDDLGTYTPSWIMCGCCMAFSGIAVGALPVVDRMYPDRLYRPAPMVEK